MTLLREVTRIETLIGCQLCQRFAGECPTSSRELGTVAISTVLSRHIYIYESPVNPNHVARLPPECPVHFANATDVKNSPARTYPTKLTASGLPYWVQQDEPIVIRKEPVTLSWVIRYAFFSFLTQSTATENGDDAHSISCYLLRVQPVPQDVSVLSVMPRIWLS